MSLLTIFTAPKPFTNPHIATIQRNAIRSWLALPEVEVVLIGEEAGMAEVAVELGVRHIPDVKRNASGTPLMRSPAMMGMTVQEQNGLNAPAAVARRTARASLPAKARTSKPSWGVESGGTRHEIASWLPARRAAALSILQVIRDV